MKHWETIQIGQFSGPLDLLLTMVKDKKMSIRDVNLVELTDQYVDYLAAQKSLDIEIASEYLTMAAQLIEIKSHYLLPKDAAVNPDEENLYEDFLLQLNRYDQIRSVTDFFLNKQNEYLKTFSKKHSKTKFQKKIRKLTPTFDETLIDANSIDLEEFGRIFKRVMMNSEIRNHDLLPAEEWDFNTVTTPAISPQEISDLILETMKTNKLKVWQLEELIPVQLLTLRNLISTFLAVLDIVRYQVVLIQQAPETLLVEFSPQALSDETMIENLKGHWYEE